MIENTYESVEAALLALIVDDASAAEVYSAMYEIAWVRRDSKATTYSEAFDLCDQEQEPWPFYWSWRSAGDLIAEARGKGESYIDVFWDLSPQSGVVSERVRKVMESLGLRPVV